MKPTIGIAILTLNAEKVLPFCLSPLLASPLKPKILIVDSASEDDTVKIAQQLGVETIVISRSDFNHGATREFARQQLGTDLIVMITPDAYAENPSLLEYLVKPIIQKQASVSYARQIPHHGADFFAAFPRYFNYPATSHIRSIQDIDLYGVYTFFCSDSCAAYDSHALDEIGGFPTVLFGEDTLVVAQLLRKGHKIAYVAEAVIKHSHSYCLSQEFRRHFDIGLVRKQHQWLLASTQGDSQRGKDYVKTMFHCLLKEKPWLLPYAMLQTAMKWLGYSLGRSSVNAPLWLKKACSSQPYYWSSKFNSSPML